MEMKPVYGKHESIGLNVEVYRVHEEEWISGEIVNFEEKKGYLIQYANSDEPEWCDKTSSQMRFLQLHIEKKKTDDDNGDDNGEWRTGDAMIPPDSDGSSEENHDEDASDQNDKTSDDDQDASDNDIHARNNGAATDDDDASAGLQLRKDVVKNTRDDTKTHRDVSDVDSEDSKHSLEVDNSESSEDERVPEEASSDSDSTLNPRSEASPEPLKQQFGNAKVLSRNALLDHFEVLTSQVAMESIRGTDMSNVPFFLPGEGKGALCCNILQVKELVNPDGSECCDTFVKLSYVEPGNKNVMLRCKSVLHTTKVVSHKDEFTWESETCTVDVDSGRGSSPSMAWDAIPGDLLFTVYDWNGGARSEYIGQVLVPLRDCIDGSVASDIHGGEQTALDGWYPLSNRNGTSIQGDMLFSIQLSIPTSIEQTIRKPEVATHPLVVVQPKRYHRRKSTDRGEMLKMRSLNKSLTLNRLKKIKQEKVDHENKALARRIHAVAPKKNIGEKARGRKHAHEVSRRQAASRVENDRAYEKQSVLAAQVTALNESVSVLLATKAATKSKCMKWERTCRKYEQGIEVENRKVKNTKSQSRVREVAAFKDVKTTTKTVPARLTHQLIALQEEHAALVEHNTRTSTALTETRNQHDEYDDEIIELQSKMRKIRERKGGMPTSVNGKREQEEFSTTRRTIRELKVSIEVLKQSCEASKREKHRGEEHDTLRVTALNEKCRKKKDKIQMAKAEAGTNQTKYEKIIADNVQDTLRVELRKLQSNVFSAEQHAPILDGQLLRTQLDIHKLSTTFQDQMHSETTESDLLLS